jgi:hypothetical protein
MIKNLKNGDLYSNRKDAKNRLGGLGAYNSSMRRGELLFVNDSSLTINHLNQKLSYEKEGNLLW